MTYTYSSDTTLSSDAIHTEPVVIAAGITVTVPSGILFKCDAAGCTLTNYGKLTPQNGATIEVRDVLCDGATPSYGIFGDNNIAYTLHLVGYMKHAHYAKCYWPNASGSFTWTTPNFSNAYWAETYISRMYPCGGKCYMSGGLQSYGNVEFYDLELAADSSRYFPNTGTLYVQHELTIKTGSGFYFYPGSDVVTRIYLGTSTSAGILNLDGGTLIGGPSAASNCSSVFFMVSYNPAYPFTVTGTGSPSMGFDKFTTTIAGVSASFTIWSCVFNIPLVMDGNTPYFIGQHVDRYLIGYIAKNYASTHDGANRLLFNYDITLSNPVAGFHDGFASMRGIKFIQINANLILKGVGSGGVYTRPQSTSPAQYSYCTPFTFIGEGRSIIFQDASGNELSRIAMPNGKSAMFTSPKILPKLMPKWFVPGKWVNGTLLLEA